jgi:hypothetical protein
MCKSLSTAFWFCVGAPSVFLDLEISLPTQTQSFLLAFGAG